MTTVVQTDSVFHEDQLSILEALHQHRLVSTAQIHELCMPDTLPRWAQDCTRELADAGLIAAVRARSHGRMKLHFLTEAGLKAVIAAPQLEDRRKLVTRAGAAGSLQAHTLAVNEVGLAFVRAARERGDECTPLAWLHEVAHPIGAGSGRGAKGGDAVISDAVLRYTLLEDGNAQMLTRFVELDRSTYQAETLVAKLRRYAQLHGYVAQDAEEEGWRRLFPNAFPQILVVLTGKRRPDLEQRRQIVLGGAAADRQIQEATGGHDHRTGFVIACALMADLREHGPFAAVFHRHTSPGVAVDWLGHA